MKKSGSEGCSGGSRASTAQAFQQTKSSPSNYQDGHWLRRSAARRRLRAGGVRAWCRTRRRLPDTYQAGAASSSVGQALSRWLHRLPVPSRDGQNPEDRKIAVGARIKERTGALPWAPRTQLRSGSGQRRGTRSPGATLDSRGQAVTTFVAPLTRPAGRRAVQRDWSRRSRRRPALQELAASCGSRRRQDRVDCGARR